MDGINNTTPPHHNAGVEPTQESETLVEAQGQEGQIPQMEENYRPELSKPVYPKI